VNSQVPVYRQSILLKIIMKEGREENVKVN
jgi:hypothetical protein